MSPDISAHHSERRDAAENRQKILEAARKLFDKYGVENVSMNQIAAEAKVGSGTLYRRYSNKSELCFDLIKDNLTSFLKDANHYLEQNQSVPPKQRLREVIRLFIDLREKKYPLLAEVDKSPTVRSSASSLHSRMFNEIHQCFVSLFDEINVAEHIHFNSVFKADMLITALSSDSYSFQREVRGYSPEDILEHICEAFL